MANTMPIEKWDNKIKVISAGRKTNAISLWKAYHRLCAKYEIEKEPKEKEALGLAIDKVWRFISTNQYLMGVCLCAYQDCLRRNAG